MLPFAAEKLILGWQLPAWMIEAGPRWGESASSRSARLALPGNTRLSGKILSLYIHIVL